ncbi:hypothetical protein PS467_14595 [Streptomyces luomodiensis]|uniref:Uncharacterized protein n=1 Tax=Streptomyces luomodiensis TaxID=3026192 RepID=A0ABY9VD85_9ACTN|nr:hypothetical protein [Streptomyces sp. SCA4-21]WNF01865.1 hypothetical protein PS467_14595 [Streptomyces sp. SCA4-21]
MRDGDEGDVVVPVAPGPALEVGQAAGDHEARTVIAVSFACMDVATASLIALDGAGDVMVPLASAKRTPPSCPTP